uniref:Uncharacterized protein n=1 Tax=Oryza glumipatula TaxID=40148 RepID=A0A0D9ZIL3_9ORYZ
MGNEMVIDLSLSGMTGAGTIQSPVLHPHSRTPVPATTIVRQSAESQALYRALPVRQPPGAPPLAAFSRTAWARALSRPSVDASSGDAIYGSRRRREPSSMCYRETLPPDKAIDAPPGACLQPTSPGAAPPGAAVAAPPGPLLTSASALCRHCEPPSASPRKLRLPLVLLRRVI